MDHYWTLGKNTALTCRYFGVSRQTFYRWHRCYDPAYLPSPEARPHRPRHQGLSGLHSPSVGDPRGGKV